MADIRFHNTLSGEKEKFVPLEPGKVKLYSCGPTVYDFAHIGNFRSFLMSDLLVRVLKYAGFDVEKVQNITDVGHLTEDNIADAQGEDKIAKKAREEKKDPYEIARFFEEAFIEDEACLRILPADHRPRATEYIPQQIDMVQKILAAGYAYEANGSVYFRTTKFEKYGQLSKNKLEDLIAGARVEVNSEKENPLDFALWKKADSGHLMQWDSPWGRGFPGWHIECSAMSHAIFGDSFDIHTGGEDNIFPHHECEIAQNETSNGGKKSVNYWLHVKYLLVGNKKMSKSDGNFFTIRDLLKKGFTGEEIRYALLTAHYRSTLNFTLEGLEGARSSIARLEEARRVFAEVAASSSPSEFASSARQGFQKELFDDLNAAGALAVVFELIKSGMKLRDEEKLSSEDAAAIMQFLNEDFDQIFDIVPKEEQLSDQKIADIEKLIAERDQFRAEKNWSESDRIRDELLAKGIELIDEEGKTVWKQK